MTPERWQQVNELFTALVELEPEERSVFLNRSCAGDHNLRSEVESLLASDSRGWNVMERPALEMAAPLLAHEQPQLTTGQTFSHYEIVELLGKGGMGEVYLAADKLLNRKIALKLLPADYTQDRERLRRFQQEAQAASALNHPNILTIHEIGQIEDRRFIATEFVDGETLRQRLKRAPLTLSEVLEIAIQVASALSAAHDAGIVHRDIKPENIMLRRDGYVKVLDFGLAKLTEQQEVTSQTLTIDDLNVSSGLVMGTVKYMSPEQARGKQIDARSDIFSLGVVLYEIVSGRLPFEGNTTNELVTAILKKEAPQLTIVPVEMQRIVSKALRKKKEERYQTIENLLVDLRSLKEDKPLTTPSRIHTTSEAALPTNEVAAVSTASTIEYVVSGVRRHFVSITLATIAIIMIASAVIYSLLSKNETAITSIAILPFDNIGSDPNLEYLSSGIADHLSNSLARIPGLTVISNNAAVRYQLGVPQTTSLDAQAVGRELKTQAVVLGKVVQLGAHIQVSVELVEVRNNGHLWGEQYDRNTTELLNIEDDIARAISEKLGFTPTEHSQRTKRATYSTEAYQAYLKGRYFWNKRTDEGYRKAAEYFQQAIDLDQNYAQAYAGLADCHLFGQPPSLPPKVLAIKAKEMATKAIELDDHLGEAHASLGLIAENLEWDWAEAERQYKQSIQLNPNYATAHQWYAELLTFTGRFDEALKEMKLASDLDPLSLIIIKDTGEIYYAARTYDRAIEFYWKALEMDSTFVIAHRYLGMAYAQKGDYSTAVSELETARRLEDSPDGLAELGYVYALSGRRQESENVLSDLRIMSARRYVSPCDYALIYAGLGEKDKAFEWLDRGYREGAVMSGLMIDPRWDSLRTNARFADLTKRMGLKS